MSDPLPTEPRSPASPPLQEGASPAGAPREGKIEQLLLTGLDHYFDGQYDQAINIWTRALFLDRGHARARAYIERARGALAERQRESEELLQRGLAAFDRGDSAEARRLLEAAITRGAPRDEALSVLDRIHRLDHPAAVPSATVPPSETPLALDARRGLTARLSRRHWLMACVALGLGSLLAILVALDLLSIQVRWGRPQPVHTAGVAPAVMAGDAAGETALPLPRRGERALGRARLLAQSGRLRDALASLDDVSLTDMERPAADRLRAEIQRQVLAAGSAAPATPIVAGPDPSAGPTP